MGNNNLDKGGKVHQGNVLEKAKEEVERELEEYNINSIETKNK